MTALRILVRLRWLVIIALVLVMFFAYRPVACVAMTMLPLVALFDFVIYLRPGGARKAAHARRDAVRRESERLFPDA